jgi:hypothetical protein
VSVILVTLRGKCSGGLERGELNAEMEACESRSGAGAKYSVDGREGRVGGTRAASDIYRGPVSSVYPAHRPQKK